MKKLVFLLFVIVLVQLVSMEAFAQKDIFIKEFQFELKKISDNQYENEYFLTITLNKNSLYKFTVLNHIGDFPGNAIIEILVNVKVVGTNNVG